MSGYFMCLALQNIKVSPETKLQHWLVHVYANTRILTAPGGYKISGCQVKKDCQIRSVRTLM